MRKLNIEFVEDCRWRWVWLAVAIMSLTYMGVGVMKWLQIANDKAEIERQISILKIQISKLIAPSAPKLDARQASAIKAAALLQFDLNTVFASIENIIEPGTRLRNMALDVSTGTLRLEYELDSAEKAVALSQILNAGNGLRPWQLESLNAIGGTGVGAGSLGSMGTTAKVIGIWNAQLKAI